MKRFKFQQKLFLLAFLVAAPLLVVLGWEFLFVRAPRELGHAPEELAAVEIQASLLKVIHELQLYRDLGHGVAELEPVLGAVDHIGLRPDQFNPVAIEGAVRRQLHGRVERRLAAERRQQRRA